MTDTPERVLIAIRSDEYFRRRPVNVRDEDGALTCDTEPWTNVEEFEQACALIDAFQQKRQSRGIWTTRGYFDMLAWGETKEAHRAIAGNLLASSKRKRVDG
jgi:hypothetical protein